MKPMNTFDEKINQVPNADDFLSGNHLKNEDIDGEITATVTDVWSEVVLNTGRKKLVVSFREFEKPLFLNKTNIKRLARIFGTGDTTVWRGPVTVYVEAGGKYAGRVVGGIHVCPAEAKSEPRGESTDQRSYSNGGARAGRYEESEVEFF
jgi:hypothetical protein